MSNSDNTISVNIENEKPEAKTYLLEDAMKKDNSDILRIRDMWIEGNNEDRQIALGWLAEKLGNMKAAKANLMLMYISYPMSDEEGKPKTKFSMNDGAWYEKWHIDEQSYFEITSDIERICFGKDYKYNYTFKFILDGVKEIDFGNDYSRHKVAMDMPNNDFASAVIKRFLKKNSFVLVSWYSGEVHDTKTLTIL